jgi:hypothetical protein
VPQNGLMLSYIGVISLLMQVFYTFRPIFTTLHLLCNLQGD